MSTPGEVTIIAWSVNMMIHFAERRPESRGDFLFEPAVLAVSNVENLKAFEQEHPELHVLASDPEQETLTSCRGR